MADIVQIIHDLSYRTDTSGLDRALQSIQAQVRTIEALRATEARLLQQRQATQDPVRQQSLTAAINNTRAAIDRQTQSLQQAITANQQLNTAVQREMGLLGSLQNKLKDLREQRLRATSVADVQRLNRELQDTQNQINNLMSPRSGSATGTVANAIRNGLGLGAGLGIAGLAAAGINQLREVIADSEKLAEQAQGVENAFNRLNKPNLLNNLREATKGTVSDLDLMKRTVQFANFGLPVDKLATALAFARTRARETGVSVDYLVESITTGIGRQSPLILDNLGINAKRVRDEFQKCGNFAEAAFKIIAEEGKKAGTTMDYLADANDRYSASIQNSEVQMGKFFTRYTSYAKAAGADLIGNLTGGPTDNRIRNIEAYQAQQDLTKKDAYKDQVLSQLEQFAVEYETVAKKGAKATVGFFDQVDRYRKQMIADAQKDYATDIHSLALYQLALTEGFNAFYARLKAIRDGAVPAKTIPEQNVDELEARISGNKNIINSYTNDDLKNKSTKAQRDKLVAENKEAQKAIDEIQAKEDNKAEKKAEKMAEQRIALEKSLSERLIQLKREQDQLLLKQQVDTSVKLRKLEDVERDAALEKINSDEAETKRKGLLSATLAARYDEVRRRIRSNSDLKYQQANKDFIDRLLQQEQDFNLNIQKLELENQQDILKILQDTGGKTLRVRQTIAERETDIALAENSKAFDAIRRQKQKEFDQLSNEATDTSLTDAQRQDAEARVRILYEELAAIDLDYTTRQNIIVQQGYRKRINIIEDALEDADKAIRAHSAFELSQIDKDSADTQSALTQRYRDGEISLTAYLQRIEKLELESAIKINRRKQEEARKELGVAKIALQTTATDPKATTKDIEDAEARVNELIKKVANLETEGVRAEQSLNDFRVAQVMRVVDAYATLSNAIGQSLEEVYQAQQKSLDREISIREKRVEYAQKLAEKGNVELLKIEQSRLDRANQQRERAARREQLVNSILTVSNATLAVARAAAEGGGYASFATVAAVIAALVAGYGAVKSLDTSEDGFYDGSYTGDGNPRDVAGVVHKKEFVFDHKATARIGKDNLEKLRTGEIGFPMQQLTPMPVLRDDVLPAMQGASYVTKDEFKVMNKKFDLLIDAVESSKVSVKQSMDKDGISQSIESYNRQERQRWK